MLLSVTHELREAEPRFVLSSHGTVSQPLVEDHFGRLIVVVLRGARLNHSVAGALEPYPGSAFFALQSVCLAHPIVDVILLHTGKFPLAERMRPGERPVQQLYCFMSFASDGGMAGQLDEAKGV